jgi:hypothetical protein
MLARTSIDLHPAHSERMDLSSTKPRVWFASKGVVQTQPLNGDAVHTGPVMRERDGALRESVAWVASRTCALAHARTVKRSARGPSFRSGLCPRACRSCRSRSTTSMPPNPRLSTATRVTRASARPMKSLANRRTQRESRRQNLRDRAAFAQAPQGAMERRFDRGKALSDHARFATFHEGSSTS